MKSNLILLILFINIFNFVYSDSTENIEVCEDGTKCNADHGKCTKFDDDSNGYFCNCKDGYATSPKEEVQCNYKQKSQLKAFLLELFLCFGSGHFYIHKYKYAIPKLVVFVFLYCLFIVLRIITKAKEENRLANLIICISAGVSLAGMLTWQIIDLVNFGKNNYDDGNDMPLRKW